MPKRKRNAGIGSQSIPIRIPRERVGRSFAARRKALVDKKRTGADVDDFMGRSGLEDRFGNFLREHDVEFGYESDVLEYEVPAKIGKYKPDFKIQGIYLETKGRFTSEDRKKMLFVFRSNPDVNLLMVFPKPNNTITRKSRTTYGDWCDKNNIPWIALEELENLIRTKENYVDLLLKRTKGLGFKPHDRRRKSNGAGSGDGLSNSTLGSASIGARKQGRRGRGCAKAPTT